MQLSNSRELEESARKQLFDITSPKIEVAMDRIVENIIAEELPEGNSSPIAKDLTAQKLNDGTFRISSKNRVWSYLNYGTGVYSDRHKGAGPGGLIIPTSGAKALHFKNSEIANALGFRDENVFLKSVKGIKPRYFLDKALLTSKFNQAFKQALSASKKQTKAIKELKGIIKKISHQKARLGSKWRKAKQTYRARSQRAVRNRIKGLFGQK